MLWCSGLIAGASILGIFAAMQGFIAGLRQRHRAASRGRRACEVAARSSRTSDLFGLGILGLLGFLMFRGAGEPKSVPGDSR